MAVIEKQEKILQASVEEFAHYGYEKASTNRIIEKAKVSKGLLFHYFGNKRELYLQTLERCVVFFEKYLQKEMQYFSDDLTERIIELNAAKLKIATEEPLMQKMIKKAFLEMPPELKEDLEKWQVRLTQKYLPLLFKGINETYFKEEIDKNKAIELIMIVVDALSAKYIKDYQDSQMKASHEDILNAFIKELRVYLELIKTGIYQN